MILYQGICIYQLLHNLSAADIKQLRLSMELQRNTICRDEDTVSF
jgi:hypothetical protein